jgi:hypothetical protein
MGFAANQARLMGLISRKSDLELEGQFIEQQKMFYANMSSGMFNLSAKLDPNSPAAKILEGRIKNLQQADKILDMHLKRIANQRDAVIKDMESLDKVISKNIETSFGIMAR